MNTILSAYTLAPSIDRFIPQIKSKSKMIDEVIFYESLVNNNKFYSSLEVPFLENNFNFYGNKFLLKYLIKFKKNIITTLPHTMIRLSKNKKYGLASNDEESRKEAVNSIKYIFKSAEKLNDLSGKKIFQGISLCSAPKIYKDSISSELQLIKSIEEIKKFNICKLDLLIEHCDAYYKKKKFIQKGFLTIEREMKLSKYGIKFILNWARSAIDGLSNNTPNIHIRKLKKDNLLYGFFFSGTSKKNKDAYGKWTDLHQPPSFKNNYFSCKNSLLTENEFKKTLKLFKDENKDFYLGLKFLPFYLQQNISEYKKIYFINDLAKKVKLS